MRKSVFIILLVMLGTGYFFPDYINAEGNAGDTLKCNFFYANTLSTHPFGIYISRINNNFQTGQYPHYSFEFNISSGNVWWPYVKSYTPTDKSVRDEMRKHVWHERETYFDKNSPAKTREITVDGTIRLYKIDFTVPVFKNQEIKIFAKAFSMDNFHFPYITSDQFIEWFHNNITREGDVFGRQEYGFDRVFYYYKDVNGKEINLSGNDFVFSGLAIAYYYYPGLKSFNKHNFFLNLGGQLGFNTTKVNPSMDLGINSTLTKIFDFKKRALILAFSGGILRQKLIPFGEGVEISTRKFLYSGELLFTYRKKLKNNNCLDFTTTYYVQSAYNTPGEFDYIVLTGYRRRHWNHPILDLYHPLTGNSFMISFSSTNFSFSVYLREDLKVDNAPDIQVGYAFKVKIH